MLEEYKYVDAAELVSNAVFGFKKDQNNKDISARKMEFHELGKKIRNGEPYIIELKHLELYCQYIKDKSFLKENLPLEKKLSAKQRKLEKASWFLYFYDQRIPVENSGKKIITGVTRAILKFLPFGKAEILSYTPNTGEPETYFGKFRIYGMEERYVKLEMHLKESKEKDLHILFYVGTGDNFQIAFGQFHNLGRTIYSGTVMLEPIAGTKKGNKINPQFFDPSKGEDKKELPEYVWLYFKDKQKNILRSPGQQITSHAEFYEWHRRKNKEQ